MDTEKAEIAFYFGLSNVKETLKGADLDLGNPGIGGTQYLFLLTVKELNRTYGGNQAIILTDGEFGLVDKDIPFAIVGTESDAIQYCECNKIEYLVLYGSILEQLPKDRLNTSVRIIAWAHNTLSRKRQLVAAQTKSIQRVICVSEKQYTNMKDTPCWEKCMFINNIIPSGFYENATLSTHDLNAAIYVGSLMPQKGAHNLLEIWREVEKNFSDAQLYIIGGANVWDPSAKLGSIGAADIYYERVLRRRLNRLKYPENVHFMGAMGWKSIDKFISSARVGIVNPSHYMRDETFCLSAIEMEAHGIPVVSRQRGDGLNTTICHGQTGYLEKTDKLMAERIVELLGNKERSMEMGEAARSYARFFLPENELPKWKCVADCAAKDITCLNIGNAKSKDAKLLEHDFLLKMLYLIESGKAVDLFSRKIKNRIESE